MRMRVGKQLNQQELETLKNMKQLEKSKKKKYSDRRRLWVFVGYTMLEIPYEVVAIIPGQKPCWAEMG